MEKNARPPEPVNRTVVDPLVRRYVRGDQTAFEHVYSKYRASLFRFIRHHVNDEASAHDLLQETFLKVHRFRGSYDPKYSFATWLWSIARNTITDFHRKLSPGGAQPGRAQAEQLPCLLPGAEDALVQKGDRQELWRNARLLTKLQRRAVWLRVVYQLPHDEIARRLNLSVTAVKSLIYRSRRLLRRERDDLSRS